MHWQLSLACLHLIGSTKLAPVVFQEKQVYAYESLGTQCMGVAIKLTKLKKLERDILKFSFHSSSNATPLKTLSHHNDVLPGLIQNRLGLLLL